MQPDTFFKILKHPVKFRMFLLSRLPLALAAGLRVCAADPKACTVSVPYRWMTRNPFRSTYFAALAMAAELSTGVLAMAATLEHPVKIALLVVKLESEYFKKATGNTVFTCTDGEALRNTVQRAVDEDLPQQFTATSRGVNEQGVPVAVFRITWSFRAKS
ncbi:DUF4442 domain-containing protein [Niabella drilacis]|uniref:Acyl-coenzyme A thioesterase PaaI, contains HGG motif n=1 Tax=Niabella drilacis (strain DSM 25811 / CCM 8410 / CCUG 62505 / LMG 26954 / E90) TaxID=1285928 RepID=A0A1G6V2N9_NIADE|nr:DUF4442 domain-containing protein [Niabella drilacis]SDD47782.1 protein of unknown function [Niabella drilacis]